MGLLIVLAMMCTTSASDDGWQVEWRRDLGHGFERVAMGDGVDHYHYLYFEGSEVANVGFASVSPTGRCAIFEALFSGTLNLFEGVERTTTDVTDDGFEIPEYVIWDTANGRAKVHYYSDKPPTIVMLPPACRDEKTEEGP